MSNITTESIRETIEHGGVELEVFQLCDQSLWAEYGQYRLSQTQVLERIDLKKNWLTELDKRNTDRRKALQSLGFTGFDVEIKFKEENSRGWKTAKSLSIGDACAIWGYHASQGNAKALILLIASTHETIERRADAKFNQTRTEEEYEAQNKARVEGKRVRHSLTDAIAWYLEDNEVSNSKRHWIYINCSDAVNIGLFGRRASKLCVDFKVKDRSKLRDSLTTDELRWLSEIEDLASRLMMYQEYEPITAVKEAISRLAILKVDRTA